MPNSTRSWTWFAVAVIGWLFVVLGILTNGDRQNKHDQRLFELEKRVHELERELKQK